MAGRTSHWTVVSVLVICLALTVSRNLGALERTCSSDTRAQRPVGICGQKLSDLLAVLCKSGYHKRSGHLPVDESLYSQLFSTSDVNGSTSPDAQVGQLQLPSPTGDDVVDASSSAFLPRQVALSLLRSRREARSGGVAVRRGVYCECCLHRCALSELVEYCRGGTTLFD